MERYSNPEFLLEALESVIDGDNRTIAALTTVVTSALPKGGSSAAAVPPIEHRLLAAEVLYRAALNMKGKVTGMEAQTAYLELLNASCGGGEHCASLHMCGVHAEEVKQFSAALNFYTRAVSAGEAWESTTFALQPPPQGELQAFCRAMEATRLASLADAVYRVADLCDNESDLPGATNLEKARVHFSRATVLFEKAGMLERLAETTSRLSYAILHACPGDRRTLSGLDWDSLLPAIEKTFSCGATNPFLASFMARLYTQGVKGHPVNYELALKWCRRALSPTACPPQHSTVQKDALVCVAQVLEVFLPQLPSPQAEAGAAGAGGGGGKKKAASKGAPLKPSALLLLNGLVEGINGFALSAQWKSSAEACFALWTSHRIHTLLIKHADEDELALLQASDVDALELLAGIGKECSGCAAASLYVAYRDGALGVKPSVRSKLQWQVRALELGHELPQDGESHADAHGM